MTDDADVDADVDVVVVRVGGRRLAVDARVAAAVARVERPALVEGAPPGMVGFVSVRGAIAALVDPRPALGLAPLDAGRDRALADQHVLVTATGRGRFALLVDEVCHIGPGAVAGGVVEVPGDGALDLVEVDDLLGAVVEVPGDVGAPGEAAGVV